MQSALSRIGYKNNSGYRQILQRISRCDALFNLPDLKLEQEGCQPLRENNKGQSILQTRQECDLRVSRSYFNPAPRQAWTPGIFASFLRATIDCILIFAFNISSINFSVSAMSCSHHIFKLVGSDGQMRCLAITIMSITRLQPASSEVKVNS